MKILYLSRNCRLGSRDFLIKAYYQAPAGAKIQEVFVRVNKNLNTIIFRHFYEFPTGVANARWRHDRKIGYERIYAIDVYQIMADLKGELELDIKLLDDAYCNLIMPLNFYCDFLTAFRIDT